MTVRIDPTSAQPPYEQLKTQLVAQMVSGELSAGARLPSVRRLAADLGLAPNTVARAYRELEHAGFVRTAGRNGTIVARQGAPADAPTRGAALAHDYATGMQALGFGPEAAVDYLRSAWQQPSTEVT